jgi:hypothetical protein
MGSSWGNAAGFVKVVLLFQAAVIIGLSVWMYSEYVNNPYLQTYLLTLFQGKGSMIAVLGLGGLLGTALLGILLKAGDILGEIEHLSEKVGDRTDVTQAGTERSMTMPVLKVVVAEPVDEIGRLHRSLQRWNKKSKRQQ